MLRVVSLNLNYYGEKHGAWPRRRALIEQALRNTDPDVVALQAVRCEPGVEQGVDQATQLAQRLGYDNVFFQPAAEYKGNIAQGSALIARVPFADRAALRLTRRTGLDDTNERVLLHARFHVPGGLLHVFNAHFSWVAEQASDNLAEALPFINAFRGPSLLLGDFNTLPESAVWAPLVQAGWQDVWATLHSDRRGYTFESNAPDRRIDYAWANRALAPRVAAIEVVADGQDESGARASDHCGLLVTLSPNGTAA